MTPELTVRADHRYTPDESEELAMSDAAGKKNKREKNKKENRLSIEELEKRVAPAVPKKTPVPPPYPPGADYGLVSRRNLSW
jgi:hypothetical protein